jgi:hypothetical protein
MLAWKIFDNWYQNRLIASGAQIADNTPRLGSLIARGKILVVRHLSRPGVLIDAESIVGLRAGLCDLLLLSEVALTLDIEVGDAESLIHHGYLKPLSGPTVDGLPEWRFDPDEIVELVKRIEGMAVGKPPASPDTLMTVGAAIRQMKIRGFSASRFVRAVLEGEIVPQVGLPCYRGISSFWVPNDCVIRFVRTNLPPDRRCMQSFRNAAKLLARMKEQNDKMFTSNKREIHVESIYGGTDIARYMRNLQKVC